MSGSSRLDLPEPGAGEEAPALFRDRQELQCKLLEWMQENLFLLLKMQRNPLPPLLPSSDKNGRDSEFEEKKNCI